ncbi:hypothetical protein MTBLM1_40163 [Rhodospirillaceae bacterium LM-1]|nr:hypothetical protein MTBLM1_40163 [Rhodospirillaceae bacterium LM-1]
MHIEDLEFLCCVDCNSRLVALDHNPSLPIVEGVLECQGCQRQFPVIGSVAIIFHKEVLLDFLSEREVCHIRSTKRERCLDGAGGGSCNKLQVKVAENWSYQWNEVPGWDSTEYGNSDAFAGKRAFWNFIPLNQSDLQNANALVACGGLGREAYHLLEAGCRRVIVNEIGDEIFRIPQMVPDSANRLILIRSDVLHLPVRSACLDAAVCDHALQHVLDHRTAYKELSRIVRPGGRVAICVYSWENNWIMTGCIEPTKLILHPLPLKLQRYIAWPMTVCVFAVIHAFYRPLSAVAPGVASHLPLFTHMMFWAECRFKFLWMAIFDLIHAPVSHHFRQVEVQTLADQHNLVIESLINTNGTLWSMIARKPSPTN